MDTYIDHMIDDLIDQADAVAAAQLFTLNRLTQTLYAQLEQVHETDEVMALSHALLAASHELRHWIDVALPGRASVACGEENEESEDTP